MSDHITIEGQDGTFAAYVARPKTSPAPAIVVLQELFGVNADIRKHSILIPPLRSISMIVPHPGLVHQSTCSISSDVNLRP